MPALPFSIGEVVERTWGYGVTRLARAIESPGGRWRSDWSSPPVHGVDSGGVATTTPPPVPRETPEPGCPGCAPGRHLGHAEWLVRNLADEPAPPQHLRATLLVAEAELRDAADALDRVAARRPELAPSARSVASALTTLTVPPADTATPEQIRALASQLAPVSRRAYREIDHYFAPLPPTAAPSPRARVASAVQAIRAHPEWDDATALATLREAVDG